jgi:hypothetical protein
MRGCYFLAFFPVWTTLQGCRLDLPSRAAHVVLIQVDSDAHLRLPAQGPEQAELILTVWHVATDEFRMDSTALVPQEDGSFALPGTSSLDPTNPPFWHANAPWLPPNREPYAAELVFELNADSLPREEAPPLSFLISKEEWVRDGSDPPQVCLWFDWCLDLWMQPKFL